MEDFLEDFLKKYPDEFEKIEDFLQESLEVFEINPRRIPGSFPSSLELLEEFSMTSWKKFWKSPWTNSKRRVSEKKMTSDKTVVKSLESFE